MGVCGGALMDGEAVLPLERPCRCRVVYKCTLLACTHQLLTLRLGVVTCYCTSCWHVDLNNVVRLTCCINGLPVLTRGVMYSSRVLGRRALPVEQREVSKAEA